jgi:hypothetical protein
LSPRIDNAGHGNWLLWLDREFGWSDVTVGKYMHVAELAGKFELSSDLELSLSSHYVLAAPSTPEQARAEVIERAEAGEHFTHAQVKEIVGRAVAEARENDRPIFEADELSTAWKALFSGGGATGGRLVLAVSGEIEVVPVV